MLKLTLLLTLVCVIIYFVKRRRGYIVFDTETSGVSPEKSVILSLSWQRGYRDWRGNDFVIERVTYYFDWPEDTSMVSEKAIEVNGLTQEELKLRGISNKEEALLDFEEALWNSKTVVGHNVAFDIKMVNAEFKRLGYSLDRPDWPEETYDTMKVGTDLCLIPGKYGHYKWPKLKELADFLKIDYQDINFHESDSDVELTKRCYLKMTK